MKSNVLKNVDRPPSYYHPYIVTVKPRESLEYFKPKENVLLPRSKPETRQGSNAEKKKNQKLNDDIKHLANRFSEKTSIQGLDKILSLGSKRRERIIWGLAFVVAVYMLISMCVILSNKYRRKQFKTVLDDTNLPVHHTPFPEIVICNANRLNWKRLEGAMDRFLLPEHKSPIYQNLFSKIVSRFDEATTRSLELFQDLKFENLELLNYVNFTNVVEYMAWRCNEILDKCIWRWRRYNCCDIFFPRKTDNGICLSFNSLLSEGGLRKQAEDEYWPWALTEVNYGSGLLARVLMQEQWHAPNSTNEKGFLFMDIEPEVWSYQPILIPSNTRAYISIGGYVIDTDPLLTSVPSSERKCVFYEERQSRDFKTLQGLVYTFENCQSECQQRYIVDYCNCTLDLFFPPSSYPVCRLEDLPCVGRYAKNFKIFDSPGEEKYVRNLNPVMKCNCFFNCLSLDFDTDIRSTPLSSQEIQSENSSYVDVNFFWRRNYFITYKTTLVFTPLDLLVSFGGIASLMLGCSLISIIELVYFIFFDIPGYLWNKHKDERKVYVKNLKHKKGSVRKLLDYDANN